MAWTAPKTDWKVTYGPDGEYTGDFFNVDDYDRIKQNIEYLREYAYFLYGGFTMRGMVACASKRTLLCRRHSKSRRPRQG